MDFFLKKIDKLINSLCLKLHPTSSCYMVELYGYEKRLNMIYLG